jgi:cation:H+ antiporter
MLLVGGDLLVKGAVGLARKFEIAPIVIGLTIVAFGTSAPELMISLKAALEGASGIAIGNVVGSNIANVLLVLGVPALIYKIGCGEDGIGRSLIALIVLSILYMALLAFGYIGRIGGLLLLGVLCLFLYDQFNTANKARKGAQAQAEADLLEEIGEPPKDGLKIGLLILAGIIALPVGANFTVNAATHIAQILGVSDEIIGLTVVAIGTSLPELATSVMAAIRRSSAVAIGNVVGSNIFNIGAIMGITALVKPMEVSPHIVHFDMWVMAATTLMVILFARYCITIGKTLGLAMLAAYVAYIGFVFI